MTTTYTTISFELIDGIGHLQLNQPPSNEMTLDFFSELAQITDEMHSVSEMKALVISGKGRHFSSGARLTELIPTTWDGKTGTAVLSGSEIEKFLERNNRSFLFLENLEIPVISAIRGVCLGSALEIALFTHFRFCGEDAVFGLPETTFHLIPGIGGISRIAALSGIANALEIVLRGNTFPAEDALKMNIVDLILPRREVVQRAIEFVKSLPADYRKEKSRLYLRRYINHQKGSILYIENS